VSAQRIKGRRADRSRGQSLVEFALILPIFFVVVFGLIDGARLVFAYNTVAQAARDAARTAAVEAPFIGACTTLICSAGTTVCTAPTSTCPANTDAYRIDVKNAADRASVIIGKIPNDPVHLALGCSAALATNTTAFATNTTNDCDTSAYKYASGGSVVTVKITVPISPLTPFWGSFYPAELSASSTMVLP
jgi:TadE-like protein